MRQATPYEPGMKVNYDADSRRVTITFRNRFIMLPGLFASAEEGLWAGEGYCRYHGWGTAESTPVYSTINELLRKNLRR